MGLTIADHALIEPYYIADPQARIRYTACRHARSDDGGMAKYLASMDDPCVETSHSAYIVSAEDPDVYQLQVTY